MRHALIFWFLIVPVVHAETSLVDVFNRELPRYQAQYAKIAPGLGRIMVVDAKYSGGLPVSVAIAREATRQCENCLNRFGPSFSLFWLPRSVLTLISWRSL